MVSIFLEMRYNPLKLDVNAGPVYSIQKIILELRNPKQMWYISESIMFLEITIWTWAFWGFRYF